MNSHMNFIKEQLYTLTSIPSLNITGTFTPLVRIEETIVPD